MQIGIYGGSFNPVHFGHVGLVKWVAEHTDLDEVWMMVSPNNPLKDSRELADEQVRLAGVRKAIEGIPHVVASDFEFHLPRPSYTANTLRALAAAYPQHTFSLIIGEDNLRILPRWREWEYIVSHYRIFVYPRRGARSGQWAVVSCRTTHRLSCLKVHRILTSQARRYGNSLRSVIGNSPFGL